MAKKNPERLAEGRSGNQEVLKTEATHSRWPQLGDLNHSQNELSNRIRGADGDTGAMPDMPEAAKNREQALQVWC